MSYYLANPQPRISARIGFMRARSARFSPYSRPEITQRINFATNSHFLSSTGRESLDSPPPTPTPQRRATPSLSPAPSSPLSEPDEDEDEDQLSSEPESEESAGAVTPKIGATPMISKPVGEPGRPRSGGYSLQQVLKGWNQKFLTQVTDDVKEFARILNMTQSYSRQPADKIEKVCQQARDKYPILLKYESQWPVRDMLKLHLKYTSERSRASARKS